MGRVHRFVGVIHPQRKIEANMYDGNRTEFTGLIANCSLRFYYPPRVLLFRTTPPLFPHVISEQVKSQIPDKESAHKQRSVIFTSLRRNYYANKFCKTCRELYYIPV